MTIQNATPYLMIAQGKAEQAIALYQRALGAKVETLRRFGDVDQSCPAAQKSMVMHAELRLGDAKIMLSDHPTATATPDQGDTLSVALNFDDADQTKKCFDALAEGGTIIEKIGQAPWGALFGALRDAHGIHWMFHCELGQR